MDLVPHKTPQCCCLDLTRHAWESSYRLSVAGFAILTGLLSRTSLWQL